MSKSKSVGRVKKGDKTSFLGPVLVLPGEDLESYQALFEGFFRDVKPCDLLEEMWTRDVIHDAWEVFRYRQWKHELIMSEAVKAVTEIFVRYVNESELRDDLSAEDIASRYSKDWAAGDHEATAQVDQVLSSEGLSTHLIYTRVALEDFPNFEKLECLISRAEQRCNAAIREIDRHRAVLASTLREGLQKINQYQLEPPSRDAA